MREDIYVIYENAVNQYKNINFNEVHKKDLTSISIQIKHLLEDLRSTLDYIATDIYNKYNKNPDRKIYFPYVENGKTEEEFDKYFNKNLPNVKKDNIRIYETIRDIQSFNGKLWLSELMILANSIKHVELKINKIHIEEHTIATDGETATKVVGNISIQKTGDQQYNVFGDGTVFVNGPGQVSFYSDGIVKIGNGIYNINDKSTNNLQIKQSYINKLFFKKLDNIESQKVLINIINGIGKLINDIEKCLKEEA